jgi:hypothetical protein
MGRVEEVLRELTEALNQALGRLPCIHGFTATAQAEVVDGVRVKATVTFRCYECKQTWSYPPNMGRVIDGVLAEHQSRLKEAGLTM